MSLLELLILLLIAGVCGAIGRSIVGDARGGMLATIAIGFIGALLGTWIARSLDLPEPFRIEVDDSSFPVLWSIVGSAIFVALISLLSGRKR